MRYVFSVFFLLVSGSAFANTYSNCTVDSVMTHDQQQNLVMVTTSCVAPDAMTSGSNCTSGAINTKSFVFDSSTVTGKAHLALVLSAMASSSRIYASTYGQCPTSLPDTLWLYALRVYRQ